MKKDLTTGKQEGSTGSEEATGTFIRFVMMRNPWNGFTPIANERVSELFAKESKEKMEIILVAVGEIDQNLMDWLKNDLAPVFNKQISIGKGMREPAYAFDRKRRQYSSRAILDAIVKQRDYVPCEKILGIVDHDLFVPELNFVFGQACQKAAVISLTRLRQTFYRLPEDSNLFHQRIFTEAVHELGHTYGLEHCGNPRCVMFFSNSIEDTDRKGPGFCKKCKNLLLLSQ